MSYLLLKAPCFHEFEEKKSRFLTYLQPITQRAEALSFLEQLRHKYPDARHHCWVFQTGQPSSPDELAFSDDGEPSGTAAKPMLQVLQYRQVSQCMAVVVRYFGGVKLGAGGLVRAYSSSVQQAVELAQAQGLLSPYVAMAELYLSVPFDLESTIRQMLPSYDGQLQGCEYADTVQVTIELPENYADSFYNDIHSRSQGRVVRLPLAR